MTPSLHFRNVFQANADRSALFWRGNHYTYKWLLEAMDSWSATLQDQKIVGTSVSLSADFSPQAVALFFALIEQGNVIALLPKSSAATQKEKFLEISHAAVDFALFPDESVELSYFNRQVTHSLYDRLKAKSAAGVILFSSGSSGDPKAILHDFDLLSEKYRTARQAKKILTFLLFDHIGGLNTLLHTLSSGGTVITVEERSPRSVCQTISEQRVEILPTTPTFLNLMLVSGAVDEFDLSSLELVTYGTEVMPESVLQRFQQKYPSLKMLQTYGLSELGILRTQSEASHSLWVRLRGENCQSRVIDGLLEIKTRTSMLGYLNAPSPFTKDGWFKTGDEVEERDGWLKILGRRSEMINVGGEKVFPAEVESVLQEMSGVEDAWVFGEPNALVGQMVVAHVNLTTQESLAEFRQRMSLFCKDRLPSFKIPQKIHVASEPLHNQRFKKARHELGTW